MNELLSVLLEETNEKLISNSKYNVEKSILFRLFKEREATIESIWQKTKEDAHKTFINRKLEVESQVYNLKKSTHSTTFIESKISNLKNSLELAKNTYKETIKNGASEYQINYDNLLKRFENDIDTLRKNILTSTQKHIENISELESQLLETFNKRKDKLEQHFNDKWTIFKGKISSYKRLVNTFKKDKEIFEQQIYQTKVKLKKKQNELIDRENKVIELHTTLKNKAKDLLRKESELELKKIQTIRNLDAEREELESERERILLELEIQRNELDAEFIEVSRLKTEANELLRTTQNNFNKTSFWENFKTNSDNLKSKMEEEKHKRHNRSFDTMIIEAENFFQLNNEYTFEDLRKEYRIKLHMYHPDKHYSKSSTEVNRMKRLFQQTQILYEVLKNEFEKVS